MSVTAPEPRERLLQTASDIFYQEGINGVGVDRVLAEAGVTRATMYRHFKGKEALVVAYLDREDANIRALLESAAAEGGTPKQLLAKVVDGIALDATLLHRRGCPFINAAAEFPDPDGEVRAVVTRHRAWFREALEQVIRSAGLDRPRWRAAELVLLRDAMMVGSYLDGDGVETAFRAAAKRVLSA